MEHLAYRYALHRYGRTKSSPRPFSELTNISVTNYDKSLQIFQIQHLEKNQLYIRKQFSIEKVVLSDISRKVLLELKHKFSVEGFSKLTELNLVKEFIFLNVYSTNRIDSQCY